MRMASSLKHGLLRLLPAALRQGLRRWYHPRLVARFTPGQWPPSAGVATRVRPGDCVVDAGANVGYVTALLAAWVGPRGRVHSFEPVPQTAELLERSVRKLGLGQVTVHRCGVSDRTGEARMAIPEYADGGENLYESRVLTAGENATGREVTIPLRTLDQELAADSGRITFMKIDVEGHEEAALTGAAATLERNRPALLIEIMGDLDQPDSSAGRVTAFLANRGYRPYVWADGWRPRQAGESAVDYFFLRDEHIGRAS